MDILKKSFEHISVEEAQALMAREQVHFVDIRYPESYGLSQIEGAVHIDNDNVAGFLDQADRKKPLIVYCYRGNASQNAANFFGRHGFERAYSLDGGYNRWHELSQSGESG
ncbi:MAG: thiosulfate sulfurtransferase GlpE [Gammaproteobacteria bacterium]|nr:thiosulfate sulfurtransferase GlpE [Gammaproteobacteria bacterium]